MPNNLTMKRIIYLCEMHDEFSKKRKSIMKENECIFLDFSHSKKVPHLIELKPFHKKIGNKYYINILNGNEEKNNIMPISIILLSDKQTLVFDQETTTITKGNLMAIYDTCSLEITEHKHIKINDRKIEKTGFFVNNYIGDPCLDHIILM